MEEEEKMVKMKTNVICIMLLFLVLQCIELSVMDGLEIWFGNFWVHYHHNFPDILRLSYVDYKNTKFTKYALAALSGLICTIPLVISFAFKCICLIGKWRGNSKPLYQIHAMMFIVLTVIDFYFVASYKTLFRENARNDKYFHFTGYPEDLNMFRAHDAFYIGHAVAEVISIASMMFMVCKGSKGSKGSK